LQISSKLIGFIYSKKRAFFQGNGIRLKNWGRKFSTAEAVPEFGTKMTEQTISWLKKNLAR